MGPYQKRYVERYDVVFRGEFSLTANTNFESLEAKEK
jgi:hypothetical protein